MKLDHFTLLMCEAVNNACNYAFEFKQSIIYDEHILQMLILKKNENLDNILHSFNIKISDFSKFLNNRIKTFKKQSGFKEFAVISNELLNTLEKAEKIADKEYASKVSARHFFLAVYTINADIQQFIEKNTKINSK